jgi:hypothetical protein
VYSLRRDIAKMVTRWTIEKDGTGIEKSGTGIRRSLLMPI